MSVITCSMIRMISAIPHVWGVSTISMDGTTHTIVPTGDGDDPITGIVSGDGPIILTTVGGMTHGIGISTPGDGIPGIAGMAITGIIQDITTVITIIIPDVMVAADMLITTILPISTPGPAHTVRPVLSRVDMLLHTPAVSADAPSIGRVAGQGHRRRLHHRVVMAQDSEAIALQVLPLTAVLPVTAPAAQAAAVAAIPAAQAAAAHPLVVASEAVAAALVEDSAEVEVVAPEAVAAVDLADAGNPLHPHKSIFLQITKLYNHNSIFKV